MERCSGILENETGPAKCWLTRIRDEKQILMVFFKIVEKTGFWYRFFRKWLQYIFSYAYYRAFHVLGKENIPPAGVPMMMVSNHQNGFIDALGILFSLPLRYKVVFLARADVFNRPSIAKILNFCKIMPIYRQRDGRENLGENSAIFDESAKLVSLGFPVTLFPEGRHQEGHYLGQVKKGFARIAFDAAERNGFPEDMWIVPVGNHYEEYFSLRSRLCISYGKPIRLSDYYGQFRENPPRAMTALAEKVQEAIGGLMLDIPDREHYALYDTLRAIVRPSILKRSGLKKSYFPDHLEADRRFAARLRQSTEEELGKVREDAGTCQDFMKRCKVGPEEIGRRFSFFALLGQGLLFLLGLPAALYGLCLTGIPAWAGHRLSDRMGRKNKMLRASIDFVLAQLIFTGVFYLIYIILYWVFFSSFPLFIVLMASWVVSRMFWMDYFRAFSAFMRRCRAFAHARALSGCRMAYEDLVAWVLK